MSKTVTAASPLLSAAAAAAVSGQTDESRSPVCLAWVDYDYRK